MRTTIPMMLAGALLTGALLAGCDKSRPTYQLTIGAETIDLLVYEDPKLIQDDLIRHVKPIWDELTTGTSVTFKYQRIASFDLGKDVERKVKAKYGENAEIATTLTTCSVAYRFFMDRNGENGVERLEPGKEPSVLLSGPSVDWGYVEWCLRENPFSIQDLRQNIAHNMNASEE
jgi:hypothetical protein